MSKSNPMQNSKTKMKPAPKIPPERKSFTIAETIYALERGIREQMPGFTITINISVTPKSSGVTPQAHAQPQPQPQPPPETSKPSKADPALQIPEDLKALRGFLNGYYKATSQDRALDLVKLFADGSTNPADIPIDKYPDLITQVARDLPGVTIEIPPIREGEDE